MIPNLNICSNHLIDLFVVIVVPVTGPNVLILIADASDPTFLIDVTDFEAMHASSLLKHKQALLLTPSPSRCVEIYLTLFRT